MDKNKMWKWLLLGFLLLWSLMLIIPPVDVKNDEGVVVKRGKIKLGLDLKGGSSFVVQVDREDVARKMVDANDEISSVDQIKESDLSQKIKDVQDIAVEMIRNRIDVLGTAEPEIYPEGSDRIIVRLPGADAESREEARTLILKDGVLNFKLVDPNSGDWVDELFAAGMAPEGYRIPEQLPQGARYYVRDEMANVTMDYAYRDRLREFGEKPADFMLQEDRLEDHSTIFRPVFVAPRIELSGDSVKDAKVGYDELRRSYIQLEFNKKGADEFARITEENQPVDTPAGTTYRQLAIILDGTLYSAPQINEPIYGGVASITGYFDAEEIRNLINVLRAGALPGRVTIEEERDVDPTLGSDSIKSGVSAIIWGGIAVLIFMGAYYLVPGMIANLSLLFVLLLLPVGMLFSSGFLGVISGSLEGGGVSLPTLTLYGIAGIVLTVGMAVDANVLTFERMREEWKVGKSISGAINAGYNKAFSTILDANVTTLLTAIILFWKGSGPIRGFAVTLSAGILVSMFIVLVITRLFFNTLADSGLLKSVKMCSIPFLQNANFNFLGGRRIAAILSLVLIIASWANFLRKGDDNFGVDFTGGTVTTFEFQQEQPLEDIRSALDSAGYSSAAVASLKEGDKPLVEMKLKSMERESEVEAQQIVLELDGSPKVIKNDSVGSQIGAELKKNGIWAIIWSLVGIIIYISIRFEFAFAMGAIVALAHDVLITVGLYCAFGRELSMPIIAALLTIVGYSVNDTIVVFDRIREDLKLVKGKSYKEIANLSINQTLSRTLLTSVTTLLTVLMLLFMGGGAVNDFALALFIGILVGTYSSVFVATPVVLLWHKEEKVK